MHLITKSTFAGRHNRRLKTAFASLLIIASGAASAFDDLTPAQTQIYDYPHLSNTKADETVEYAYRGTAAGGTIIDDTVKLNIGPANADRRDVAVEFLSGDRRLPLPDFPQYRGNPVIIVMLEHIAQSMGKIAGGGALYFRNRIRNNLSSEELLVTSNKLEKNGKTIETRLISLTPFSEDPNLTTYPQLQDAVLSITLSDDVSAGVYEISIESAEYEGKEPFKRTLTLNSQPAE